MYTFLAAVENLAMGELLGGSFMNALIVIVVVFAALVLLSLVIALFGKFGGSEKNEAPKAVAPVATAPAVAKPAAAPIVSGNDEDEVAAVIAAAVAMMAPAGVTYRVRRITPAGNRTRSEWAAAAVRQNTMPF